MKKGILIIVILLGLIIFKDIPGVLYIIADADTTDSWFFDLQNHGASNFNFVNHTSNGITWLTNDTQVITQNIGYANGDYYNDIYIDYNVNTHTGNVSIATNGVSISYFTNSVLKQNYLYNIASYMCSNNNITSATGRLTPGQTSSDAIDNNVVYTATNRTAVGNVLKGRTTADNLTNCVVYTTNVVPIANSSWVNLKLTASTSISNTKLYFVGFEIKEIGLYDQQIQNIINNSIQNSNIATTNDLNSMQSSIEQNQNENTQAEIESQKICNEEIIDKNDIVINGYYLNSNGQELENHEYGITDYIETKKITNLDNFGKTRFCFYDNTKTLISCLSSSSAIGEITIPTNTKYTRFSINKVANRPQYKVEICKNGNQAMMDQDHTYNNDPSETIDGQQDIDNLKDAEEDLMNSLDFSGANNLNITINPNASNFIWQIIENLRNMNASIVLLWTSILGLGIIKLVLNR